MEKLLFIITGPSGAGKNTVMTHIRRTFPQVKKAVTYTTRAPRPHEVDGEDYRFISEEEFFAKVRDGSILEYEQVYNDYYYGSPADIFSDGSTVKIMEMDWKGHRTYRKHYCDINIVSLFLIPPSLEEIRKRILARSQVDNLRSRLANALEQLEHVDEYTYLLVNKEKDLVLKQVEAVVRAELIKQQRRESIAFAQRLIAEHRQ